MSRHSATTASLSLHVLDTTHGVAGAGMRVELHVLADADAETYTPLGTVTTDATGRIAPFENLPAPQTYRLTFHTAEYWKKSDATSFYPHVRILFSVQPNQHYHVPLLVSPFGYSTYRGN